MKQEQSTVFHLLPVGRDLAALQQGDALEFVSYGDGIFPIETHCIGKHVINPTE